jgi:zinc transport system substrate-binding protein
LKITYKLAFIFLIFLLAACSANPSEPNENNGKLNIYTTVFPLKDFTEKIGGEYVEVASVYPPGADEHSFEPSQKDMMDMSDSDIFFYIGLGLEGFVDQANEILEKEEVNVVATGENISLSHGDGSEEEHADDETAHEDHAHGDEGHLHDINPHVWLDPVYSKQLAESIYNTLAEEMPEHKKEFQSNLSKLQKQLDELDTEFNKLTKTVSGDTIYVSHAAYSYWEERYGIHQQAIAGLNSADEPSQKELKHIIDQGKKDNVQYILFEQNISSRLTEVVQKELNAKALYLHNLSVLTEEDEKNNEDYFSLMKQNIETLRKALQ